MKHAGSKASSHVELCEHHRCVNPSLPQGMDSIATSEDRRLDEPCNKRSLLATAVLHHPSAHFYPLPTRHGARNLKRRHTDQHTLRSNRIDATPSPVDRRLPSLLASEVATSTMTTAFRTVARWRVNERVRAARVTRRCLMRGVALDEVRVRGMVTHGSWQRLQGGKALPLVPQEPQRNGDRPSRLRRVLHPCSTWTHPLPPSASSPSRSCVATRH